MEISAERMAIMVRQYEKRLEINKRWAKKYYDANAVEVKQKRLFARIAKGCCPSVKTVERLSIDRAALIEAWCNYVSTQNDLSEKARAFHLYLIGSEYVPK